MANQETVTINLQTVSDISDVVSNVKRIQQVLSQLKMPDALKTQFTKTFEGIEKSAEKASEAIQNGFKTKGDVNKFDQSMSKINTLLLQLQTNMKKIPSDTFKDSFEMDPSKVEKFNNTIKELETRLKTIRADGLEAVKQQVEKISQVSSAKSINKFFEAFKAGDVKEAEAALRGLERGLANMTEESKNFNVYSEAVKTFKQELSGLKGETEGISTISAEIERVTQEFEKARQDGIEKTEQAINNLSGAPIDALRSNVNKYAQETSNAGSATQRLGSEIDQFKNKVAYFFGLNNAVNLFKRAVKSAFETVKELDKAMTETAVVTKFSVGDMWSQLPEHTKRANELGVSIKGLYEAETIYYQQGLKTNQVQAISNATLKMARIAGLDAADATDRMTNALRGFNMEINETNADKVADVYSKLAAMSASNVDEISTAMTKVASLASSANMEFETTAAFLSQIVETTRERAETAGTALKTIIARFTEVKELYNQGQFTGTDAEGEAIEVNKVATALKTAGVNMNEFFAGTKGLDQIFIELASKWDSLDTVQQRYIATMAAGSRQQSRFIAMMSDYGRTQELVAAANSAAGAADIQYAKTLESLETSLTRLKNAWDTFVSGIANNSLIKGVVDTLTDILNGINSIIDAVSGGSGLVQAILSIGAALAALKLGSWLSGALFGGLSDAIHGQGFTMGARLGQGIKEGAQSTASAIRQLFSKDFWIGMTPVIDTAPSQKAIQEFMVVEQQYLVAHQNVANAQTNMSAAQLKLTAAYEAENKAQIAITANMQRQQQAKAILTKTDKTLAQAETLQANAMKMGIKNTQVLEGYETKITALKNKRAKAEKVLTATQQGASVAEKQVATAMQGRIIAEKGVAAASTESINSQTALTAAEQARNNSLTALSAQLGLTEAQQGVLNAAVAMGVPGDVAAKAAMNGLTQELYNRIVAESILTTSTDAEAQAEVKRRVELYNSMAAETANQGVMKMGLLTRIATYTQLLFGNKATRQSAMAKLAEAGATGVATGAQWGLNAAMEACPLGWILLAVAALIALIVVLVKLISDNTPAAKLEAAKEAAENASNAAQHAAESYQNLSDSWDSLSDKYSALDDMTKGTREWNAAVQEINSEVLDLIDEYGELADAVEMDEDGVLRIDENAMDEAIENRQNNSLMAQSAALAAKQKVVEAQVMVDREKAYNEAVDFGETFFDSSYNNMERAIKWMTGDADELAKKVASGELRDIEEIQAYADSIGLMTDITDEDVEALEKFGRSLNEAEAQNQAYLTAMAANAQQMANVPEEMSEYSSDLLGPEAMGRFQDAAEDAEETVDKSNRDEKREEYAKMMGYKDYAAYEEENGEILDKDLQKQLAAAHATENAANSLEKITKKMEQNYGHGEKGKSQSRQFAAAVSGDASKLTAAEIKGMKGKTAQQYAEELGYTSRQDLARDLGYSDKKLSEMAKEDQRAALKVLQKDGVVDSSLDIDNLSQDKIDELVKQYGNRNISVGVQLDIDMEQANEQMQKELETVQGKINNKVGETVANSLDGYNLEVMKNISNQINTMSNDMAEEYIQSFNTIIDSVDPSKAGELADYLSSIDASNIMEVSEAMDYMNSIGADPSAMQQFWDTCTNGAGFFATSLNEVLTLMDRLAGKINSFGEIKSRFEEGKATFDDVSEMIASGMKMRDFEWTGSGWKAKDGKIDKIEENMKQYEADKAMELYENQLQQYDDVVKRQQETTWTWTDDEGKKQTANIISLDQSTGKYKLNVSTNGRDWTADDILDLEEGEVADRLRDFTGTVKFSEFEAQGGTWDQWLEQLKIDYEDAINLLNNGEEINEGMKIMADYAEAATYGSSKLKDIKAQNGTLGSGEMVSNDAIIYALQSEAQEAGVDSADMMAYADALQLAKEGLDDVTAAEVALGNAKMNLGLEEIMDSYEDWTALIDESSGTFKMETMDDAKVLSALKQSMNKMLNTSQDLSNEFWNNAKNIDLMKRAAEGDEEALGELQVAAAQDYLLNIGVPDITGEAVQALEDLSELIGNYKFPKLNAGDILDDQAFIDECNDLIRASNMTAEQVSEAYKAMGFSVKLKYVDETRMVTGSKMQKENLEYDDFNNLIGWEETITPTKPKRIEGSFPVIETLTSTGSGGGGISVSNQKTGASNAGKGSSGGGSSSDSKKTEQWENPYDELYNTQEKLNGLLKERNRLEKDYDRLIEREHGSIEDIMAAREKEMNNLKQQAATQAKLLEGKKAQLDIIGSNYYKDEDGYAHTYEELGLMDHISWNVELGTVEIDQDFLRELEMSNDSLRGEAYVQLQERISELVGETSDILDELYDIEDAVWEQIQQEKQDYVDFYNWASEQFYDLWQRNIDALSEEFEALDEHDQKVLDNLQESIDLQRQIRDNTRTEEDIAEKEQRLAYLQRDTSGAHDVEILKLQEELQEARDNYRDQLIDQAIQQMQDDADFAASQRADMINAMQEQLEEDRKIAASEELIKEWMDNFTEEYVDENGETRTRIDHNSELFQAWAGSEDYTSMSKEEQKLQEQEILTMAEKGIVGKNTWEQEYYGNEYDQIKTTIKQEQTKAAEEAAKEKESWQKRMNDLYGAINSIAKQNNKNGGDGGNGNNGPAGGDPYWTYKGKKILKKDWNEDGSTKESTDKTFAYNNVGDRNNDNFIDELDWKLYLQSRKGGGGGGQSINLTHSTLSAYASGGLADSTGPAWLDGTKSKPELVLKPTDTKNFIALKDILASLMRGGLSAISSQQQQQQYGDLNFDIKVDATVDSDYSVDEMVDRIKQQIVNDASYRNVNLINYIR